LIESHFICAYRLVSIALPYNTNQQQPSEFVLQTKHVKEIKWPGCYNMLTMPSKTTRSALLAIKASSGDTLDKSITWKQIVIYLGTK
jgi:hypothetical protein